MALLAWAATGFAVGSLPVGVLVVRLWSGSDIRAQGTGNIGASNVYRNVGLAPAAVVGVATFLQGALPALGGAWFARDPAAAACAGVGAVAGYAWTPWLRFRGGSAVGAATGVLAVLSPVGFLPLLSVYAVGGILRQPALGVLCGLGAYACWVVATPHTAAVRIGALAVTAIVLLKRLEGFHRELGSPRARSVFAQRFLFDRKPGGRLVGGR
jgi:acyl phosphate:glycerol-3-phosphate acyltransferase